MQKVIILIFFMSYANALTTQEIINKFHGDKDYSFYLELKDGSRLHNINFFTYRTNPIQVGLVDFVLKKQLKNINISKLSKDKIFVPREDMTIAISKNEIKEIRILDGKGINYFVFNNNQKIYAKKIAETNHHRIYKSDLFGKIKVKKRKIICSSSAIGLNKKNNQIVYIGRHVHLVSKFKTLKGLENLKGIMYLSVQNTEIKNIENLKGLSNLIRLNVPRTLKDIKYIDNFKKLKQVDLSYTKIEDISI